MFPGAVERRNCIDRCAYASSTTLYPSHGHPRNFDIFDILGWCTVCTEIALISYLLPYLVRSFAPYILYTRSILYSCTRIYRTSLYLTFMRTRTLTPVLVLV